jgi:ESCRT-I complex subunit VPS28
LVSYPFRAHQLDCPLGYHRLVVVGIPDVPAPIGTAKIVAEVVQYFITLMDSLKLGMVAVDEIQPLLGDLISSLNQVNTLPPEFEAKQKVQHWLTTLNKMKASDELDKEQIRQMMFDLESSYNAFHRAI